MVNKHWKELKQRELIYEEEAEFTIFSEKITGKGENIKSLFFSILFSQ